MGAIVGPLHEAGFNCCGFPEDGTRRVQNLPRFRVEADEALRMAYGNCAGCERYGMICGTKGRVGVPEAFSVVGASEVRSR